MTRSCSNGLDKTLHTIQQSEEKKTHTHNPFGQTVQLHTPSGSGTQTGAGVITCPGCIKRSVGRSSAGSTRSSGPRGNRFLCASDTELEASARRSTPKRGISSQLLGMPPGHTAASRGGNYRLYAWRGPIGSSYMTDIWPSTGEGPRCPG